MMRIPVLLAAAALSLHAESGRFTIHMILHAVGEEGWEMVSGPDGLTLTTTFEYADRGNTRTTNAELKMRADYTPVALAIKQRPNATGIGASPFALQMAAMRYWKAHGEAPPAPLRAGTDAPPLEIRSAGRDSITVDGKQVALDRFTVGNLMFGREVLWMNQQGELAAAMTFAGGLPMEAVRTEYEESLPQLYRSGVAQQMANLASLGREVQPERTGSFAIAGARLVDGTGAPPIEDSVVIVRDGRIAAAGARSAVPIPAGMAVVDARGRTLLPGLWEMHTHYSGVEFGPALLAAGITTARDCGGEFGYLVAQRDAAESNVFPAPRLLLAGLVDAGGLKAFGHVTAETAKEGRAVVDRYQSAGFQQIKLYTFLTPDVVRAIAAEAHRLGMTVTGHVPQAMNAFEGVEAGMDQINHLNYASRMLREAGEEKALAFFKEHGTVIDPTAGWGEMASHAKDADVAEFEPGILRAPFVLNAKYRGMGGAATLDQMRSRMAQTLAAIGALHKAGIPIVPGSDTGLVGHGLHRELELYVQAGMTPMEAIQSATIVSARAMKLDGDSGTIQTGKRADLVLIDGNPLRDIREIRKVSQVVTNGRLYNSAALWRSVGFR
jgi:imidazolonepropionase-like amidohydrolase